MKEAEAVAVAGSTPTRSARSRAWAMRVWNALPGETRAVGTIPRSSSSSAPVSGADRARRRKGCNRPDRAGRRDDWRPPAGAPASGVRLANRVGRASRGDRRAGSDWASRADRSERWSSWADRPDGAKRPRRRDRTARRNRASRRNRRPGSDRAARADRRTGSARPSVTGPADSTTPGRRGHHDRFGRHHDRFGRHHGGGGVGFEREFRVRR